MFGTIGRFIERRRFALSQRGPNTVLCRTTAAGYGVLLRPLLPSVAARYAGLLVPATRKLGDIAFVGFLRPETDNLECHGTHRAPTEQVAALLRDRGYKGEPLGIADPRFAAVCDEKDLKVLLARRQ